MITMSETALCTHIVKYAHIKVSYSILYVDYTWVTLPRGMKGECLISKSDQYNFYVSPCIQGRFKVLIHDCHIECGPYELYNVGCDQNADHVDPDGRAKKLHCASLGLISVGPFSTQL